MFYCIFCFVTVLSIVYTEKCNVGSPESFDQIKSCDYPYGGCAVIRYDREVQEYGLKSQELNAYSMCMTKIQPLHPLFIVMDCAASHNDASCYDQNTPDTIELELHSLGVREQSIGEVLRLHGINRICCCKGHACNKDNEKIIGFFSHDRQMESFKDTMNVSYNPREKDQPKPLQRPHHNHHRTHGKPSSTTELSMFVGCRSSTDKKLLRRVLHPRKRSKN